MGLFGLGPTRYEKQIAQERANYSSLLNSLPINNNVTDVLDVACGNGDIARVVKDRFDGNYYGIDINPEHIIDALEEWSTVDVNTLSGNGGIILPEGIYFACGDAIDLHKVADFPQYYDMVISRHPQSGDSMRSTFKRIYEVAVSRLVSGGYFLVTTFTKEEYDGAIEMLQNLGVNIDFNHSGENKFAGGQRSDKYVIFGVKS